MRRLTAIAAAILLTPVASANVDITRATLRAQMLRLINADRIARGLAPVALDPAASSLADTYCRRQIRDGTTGHFTTDGLAPYMRYSFAGGNDAVAENAAAWSASHAFEERELLDMLRRSHEAMMAERPPRDGHRRTILDPHATHVGIGLAWEGGEFRIAQEFLRRYLEWTRPLPRGASAGERVTATARPVNGHRVEAISIHHEPLPQPLTRAAANAIDDYRLPDRRRDYLPRLRSYSNRNATGVLQIVREEYAGGRSGDFSVADDGSFTFSVPLSDGPGVYTVVVWVKKRGAAAPVAASSVSIRVDAPQPSHFGTE